MTGLLWARFSTFLNFELFTEWLMFPICVQLFFSSNSFVNDKICQGMIVFNLSIFKKKKNCSRRSHKFGFCHFRIFLKCYPHVKLGAPPTKKNFFLKNQKKPKFLFETKSNTKQPEI